MRATALGDIDHGVVVQFLARRHHTHTVHDRAIAASWTASSGRMPATRSPSRPPRRPAVTADDHAWVRESASAFSSRRRERLLARALATTAGRELDHTNAVYSLQIFLAWVSWAVAQRLMFLRWSVAVQ